MIIEVTGFHTLWKFVLNDLVHFKVWYKHQWSSKLNRGCFKDAQKDWWKFLKINAPYWPQLFSVRDVGPELGKRWLHNMCTLPNTPFLEAIASQEVTFSLSDSVTFLQEYLSIWSCTFWAPLWHNFIFLPSLSHISDKSEVNLWQISS